MKKSMIVASAAVLFSGLLSTSCGKIITIKSDKDNIERKLNITGSFNAIETNGTTDVKYVNGPLNVVLSAPEEIIDYINVEVKGGRLVVSMKKEPVVNGSYHSTITVSAPGVSKFLTYGTGDFDIAKLDGKDIVFETYGTGDFDVDNLNCSSLVVISGGTGDVDIKQLTANFADFSTSGTGDFEIRAIKSDKLKIMTSGTGDVYIKSGRVNHADLFNSSIGDIDLRGVYVGSVNTDKAGNGDIDL